MKIYTEDWNMAVELNEISKLEVKKVATGEVRIYFSNGNCSQVLI